MATAKLRQAAGVSEGRQKSEEERCGEERSTLSRAMLSGVRAGWSLLAERVLSWGTCALAEVGGGQGRLQSDASLGGEGHARDGRAAWSSIMHGEKESTHPASGLAPARSSVIMHAVLCCVQHQGKTRGSEMVGGGRERRREISFVTPVLTARAGWCRPARRRSGPHPA